MALPIDGVISAENVWGALSVIILWLGIRALDHILKKAIDRRVFQSAWRWVTKRAKAFWTRKQAISAEFEFSVYVSENISVEDAHRRVPQLIELTEEESNSSLDLREGPRWDDSKNSAKYEMQYMGASETYDVIFTFNDDSNRSDHFDADSTNDVPLSSIGVTVQFDFAFHELKDEIIELGNFTTFLQRSFRELFEVDQITTGDFVVSPIKKDLTLDEWVNEEQFEVSLLLQADEESRSVRFYPDRAIITTPTKQMDKETTEYIRQTLLNYYL